MKFYFVLLVLYVKLENSQRQLAKFCYLNILEALIE